MTTGTIKVVIVGEAGVGKTSFVHCAVNASPLDNIGQALMPLCHQPTIGAVLITTKRSLNGKRSLTLSLWDTAGEERFDSITSAYFRHAKVVFLMFDVGNRETFEKLQSRWVPRVSAVCEAQMPYFVVLGNKIDLECVVADDEVIAWANTIKADYFRTTNIHSNGNYARTTLDIIAAHLVRSGVVGAIDRRLTHRTTTVDLRVPNPQPRRCAC